MGILKARNSIKNGVIQMNLTDVVAGIVPQDQEMRAQATARLEQLTMPYWALGRLMDLAVDLAGITRSMKPPLERRTVVTMAGDHGIVAEGVSKYPQEVTCQMVGNFVNGGAGINAVSRVVNAKVVVVDMGVAGDLSAFVEQGGLLSKKVAPGTRNMAQGPAMTREEAIRSVEAGIEVALDLGESTDIFCTGDMGIGNTTPSSAIVSVVTGKPPAEVTGKGTGIDDGQFEEKISVIEKVLAVNKPDPHDALDVLMKVGGFEIGGIAGLILGAAYLGKPVMLDGFISTAGALIAHGIAPVTAEYMISGHRSVEQGHRVALSHLGKTPLLDLGLEIG